MIVAEHPGLLASLRDWLHNQLPACDVIMVDSLAESLQLVTTQQPDMILLDFGLQPQQNISAIRQLHAILPSARIIAMTDQRPSALHAEALAAGACAMVQKTRMVLDLIPTILQQL
jgi:DNA-binding NarL/FixJ family response regulator